MVIFKTILPKHSQVMMLVLLLLVLVVKAWIKWDLPSPLFSDRAKEAEVSNEGFYEKPEFWLSVAIFVLYCAYEFTWSFGSR